MDGITIKIFDNITLRLYHGYSSMTSIKCCKIIAVTETWIQNNSPSPYGNLENYNFISNSKKIAKGGGVGLYIKNCYKFNLIDELTIMNEKIFESIFIKIQLDNENLFCGNIYRSPSNDNPLNENFLNNLYNCIHNSNESLNKCFITGDFNYDLSNPR